MFYELLNQDWKFRNCSLSFFIVLSMVANLPTILLVPRKATAIALDLIPQSIVFSSTEFCSCELLVYDFALCRAISLELTCSQLLCLIESHGDLDKLKELYHIGFNKILGFDMNSFISCSCTCHTHPIHSLSIFSVICQIISPLRAKLWRTKFALLFFCLLLMENSHGLFGFWSALFLFITIYFVRILQFAKF